VLWFAWVEDCFTDFLSGNWVPWEVIWVGVGVDDKDYHSMIILSLPTYLSNFASGQLFIVKLYSPSKTIEPDALISLILEEFKHQKTHRGSVFIYFRQDLLQNRKNVKMLNIAYLPMFPAMPEKGQNSA
jgi:hypothetical protein